MFFFNWRDKYLVAMKGGLRLAIFKSAEKVHGILLCYLGDAVRCAVSADLKMVARNRPLVANEVKNRAMAYTGSFLGLSFSAFFHNSADQVFYSPGCQT